MSEASSYPIHGAADALAALRALAARGSAATGDDPALTSFLDWLATAGRGGDLPAGEERAAFVAASAPLLLAAVPALERYVHHAGRPFSREWYGDEWVRAAEARTRIELLLELYRGSPAEAELARAADPCDLDDGFRQRGKIEGNLPEAQIPVGTPPAHWWWWYPRTPPGQ